MPPKKNLTLPTASSFRERMEFVIRRLGGPGAAAKLINVTEESLSNWKKEKVSPSFNGIKLLAKAAGVSLDWLTYGDSPSQDEELMFVPYLDFGNPYYQPKGRHDFAVRRQWVRDSLNMDPAHLAMAIAHTDNMAPTINPGDVLLMDTSVSAFKTDGIYLLHMNGASLLRRVQIRKDGSVLLKTDNERYREERLSVQETRILKNTAFIIWISRRS